MVDHSDVPIVHLESVAKTYYSAAGEVHALKELSLSVPSGSIYGILGRSGAGKSTLIRLINGLERPGKGRVLISGRDLHALSRGELKGLQRKTGMIFQHFNLVNALTVRENVTLPLRLSGVSRSKALEMADRFLAMVGLTEKSLTYPSLLSGGQKQRVAIARALAMEPDLLLSDEATSALDPETKESILQLLQKINRELGITIILITHELEVVQKICHRAAVLDGGALVEEGEVFKLFTDPESDITRSFLRSVFHEQVMPEVIKSASETPGKYVRLSYRGGASVKPALAEAAREFDVLPNILSGIITDLGGKAYGRLTVHLKGIPAEVDRAIGFLISEGVGVREVDVHEL